VQQGGEQDTVCPGEARFVGLSLQDGELVAQGEDLDVLVGVAHRQQPDEGEHACERQIGQSQQHDRSSWRAWAAVLSCSEEPAGHRLWTGFSAPHKVFVAPPRKYPYELLERALRAAYGANPPFHGRVHPACGAVSTTRMPSVVNTSWKSQAEGWRQKGSIVRRGARR
jgi:hypothetical protein